MLPPSALDTALQALPPRPDWLRPHACPVCGYSLEGLPEVYRCPECGFAYDAHTFILSGIPRGTGDMQPGRKLLWAFMAISVWLGMSFWPVLVLHGYGLFAAGGAVLLVTLTVWLLTTGRRNPRSGTQTFLFAPNGFGYCGNLNPVDLEEHIVPWHKVSAVRLERKGANWHRLRIGSGSIGRLTRVQFDAGVRCDAATARWIQDVLAQRIRGAHATGQSD